MESLVSPTSPLPLHLSRGPKFLTWPLWLPPLFPPRAFSPLSLSCLSLSSKYPALPSYTLICALEVPGNPKFLKKLELSRVSGVKTTEHLYSAAPCPSLYHSAFSASSLLKTFSCLPHFFLPSQALPWWHYFRATQNPPKKHLDLFIILSKSLFSLQMLSVVKLDSYYNVNNRWNWLIKHLYKNNIMNLEFPPYSQETRSSLFLKPNKQT